MHIAFVSPAWPLKQSQNGIVTYVHWMKHELELRGHRVSVFTGNLRGAANDDRVHQIRPSLYDKVIWRISRKSHDQRIFRAYLQIARAIQGVHRRDPIDIVEMEESFGWFAEVAERTSLPTVVKLHGPAFLSMVGEERRSSFGQERIAREGQALSKAVAVSSPSLSTLRQTIARYDLKPALSRLIVNPMTLPDSAPLWNLDSCNKDTILFVGRFDLLKGGDVALKAFRFILERKQTCRLIFVGPDIGLEDPAGGRMHFSEYRDSVFPAELRERVDYRGPLSSDEVARLRAEALVTVVTSRQENLAYTLLEAMLQGCPVVSSNAGGCPEIVDDGRTGLLARSEDAEDFAAKILSVLDDPLLGATLGRAARLRALETYSAQKVVSESLGFYAEVISKQLEQRPVLATQVER